MSSSIRVS